MKTQTILLLIGATAAGKIYSDPDKKCRKKDALRGPDNIKNPLKPVESLPDNYIWNNVNGVNYLTNIRN